MVVKPYAIGVILSGGKSSRMGSNKAFLELNKVKFIEIAINTLKQTQLISKIYINSQTILSPEYEHIKDRKENLGPIAGIYSALQYNPSMYNKILCFIPIDMPLLNALAVQKLIQKNEKNNTCYTNHPLPIAIYNTSATRKIITDLIKLKKTSIKEFIKETNTVQLSEQDFNKEQFTNVNFRSDFCALDN